MLDSEPANDTEREAESALVKMGTLFAGEFDRVTKAQQSSAELTPLPASVKYRSVANDVPSDNEITEAHKAEYEKRLMQRHRAACQELKAAEILPKELRNRYAALFAGNDPELIAAEFPSAATVCLAILPFTTGGIPLSQSEQAKFQYFYKLGIFADGLTEGFGSNPGFYYNLLPQEIQEQCTFQVPAFKSGHLPSPEEVGELGKLFFEKLDNLKRLLEKKKKRAA